MESGESRLKPRQFIENLAASGRLHFDGAEAQSALGISAAAVKVALNRLAKRHAIASPFRGFYVIVPPEYRSLGCLPADQFIPDLMKALKAPYYAGLLTAAQYHGAAHHRPQEFQVLVDKTRRPIACGDVRVAFMARKRLREVPVQSMNTMRGALLVSTPEATALDLVGYQHRAGGLDNVATVLSELAERLDPAKLAAVAATAPLPWAQRLGYLLERVGAGDKAQTLKDYVRARAHDSATLLPTARKGKSSRDENWKLVINAEVEPEL
jgi:predicted transcriptional regulator of viral defense system